MKTDGSDQNTKVRGEITPQQREVTTLRGELQRMTTEFGKALPVNITPERMSRIILTAVQSTPKLAECSRVSFFGAVMQACQLGLEPNTPLGQAYLIPRWNGTKKCLECNFQMGYQGIIDLAYRSDKYKRITAEVVYEGDEFDFEYGLDSYLRHKPLGKSEKQTFVYALLKLQNGGEEFKVWTWNKVMQHAERFSESFDKSFSPWKANVESQEAMAKKTVLIDLLKYAPKSVQVATAMQSDERVLTARKLEDGAHTFVSIEAEEISAASVNTNTETPPSDSGASQGGRTTGQNTDSNTVQNGNAEQVQRERAGADDKPAGNALNGAKNGLFSSEESAALETQYGREQTGPNFG